MAGKTQRQPETKIFYREKDRAWHAFVAVRGTNGQPTRVHRQNQDYDTLVAEVNKLEDKRRANVAVAVGKRWKFGPWLEFWHANIAPLTAGYNTLRNTYGNSIKTYLVPMLGGFYLDELTPSKFNTLYRKLQLEGLAESTIGLIHATARVALNAAVSEGIATTNVVKRATAPSVRPNSPPSFTDDEIERILGVLEHHLNPARWYLALLGARQGEALGLGTDGYSPDTGIVSIYRQLQRRAYEHGCPDPVACAKPNCRVEDCPGRAWEHGCTDPVACARPHCNRKIYPSELTRPRKSGRVRGKRRCGPQCTGHARACPQRAKGKCRKHTNCKPCPAGCDGHARQCPQRIGGLVLVELEFERHQLPEETDAAPTRGRPRKRSQDQELEAKTPAGNRRSALPEFAAAAMNRRLEARAVQRERTGSKWEGEKHGNVIFCDDFGKPIDPKRDWAEWGKILEEARVRYREPHCGRRTAATVMLKMKVDRRIIMAFFGWASEAMLKRYQDVPDELLIEAAASVGDRYQAGGATGGATEALEIEELERMIPSDNNALN